jgi:transposase InsO family protein
MYTPRRSALFLCTSMHFLIYTILLTKKKKKKKKKDNGGEYISSDLRMHFCKHGIIHQTIRVDTLWQNGIAVSWLSGNYHISSLFCGKIDIF